MKEASKRALETFRAARILVRVSEISKRGFKRGPETFQGCQHFSKSSGDFEKAPEIFSVLKFTPTKTGSKSAPPGARWGTGIGSSHKCPGKHIVHRDISNNGQFRIAKFSQMV